MDFGFGTTTLADLKSETRLLADKTDDFLNRWNLFIAIPPRELIDRLIAHTPYRAELEMSLDGNGGGDFNLTLRTDKGEKVAELQRTLDYGRSAITYDSMWILPDFAGKGLGRRLEANAVALYEKIGIRRIDIEAGGTIGAYSWARFGFLPQKDSWKYLRDRIATRLEKLGNKVSGEDRAFAAKLLKSDDPRAIWPLVDMRAKIDGQPLAVHLLKDMPHGWQGHLLLTNPEQRGRFNAYVAHAPKLDQTDTPKKSWIKRIGL